MSDLTTILVVIIAFGGLSIIGVVILLSGLIAAERTSSVIWCAGAAALLFAVQLGWIGFWHSFGLGFGGEDIKGRTILQWGGVTAVVLVGGFLALKLPSALGRVFERARWWQDGARVAALIVVVYILYLAGVLLLRWVYLPGGAAPSPTFWIVPLGGAVLAWGLWRHRSWAWAAALVCCIYAIARIVWLAYPDLPGDLSFPLMATPAGVRLMLLAPLLAVLLFSNARALCRKGNP